MLSMEIADALGVRDAGGVVRSGQALERPHQQRRALRVVLLLVEEVRVAGVKEPFGGGGIVVPDRDGGVAAAVPRQRNEQDVVRHDAQALESEPALAPAFVKLP